ncbi:MAG: hypothetical protein QY322_00285 [bacterium]|nr:MAG: hypothetical protein QY322_00285 [bacterium]
MNILVSESTKQARIKYRKLAAPKLMSEELYIRNWIYDVKVRDRAEVEFKNINPSSYQASVDFFITYHPELRTKLQNEIWGSQPEKRGGVWEKFRLPYKRIEESFSNLIAQRKELVFAKGYEVFVDYYLDLYKIPKSVYKDFIRNNNKVIEFCNSHTTHNNLEKDFFSEFGNHCSLCNLKNFPFGNLGDVTHYMSSNNVVISMYKSKVDIEFGDFSQSNYIKETDRFKVQIDKNQNLKHQSIDLIHELSHIIHRIGCYKNEILPEEKGSYFNELQTTKIELDILKVISTEVYNSIFGEFLKVFHRVLFEIEIYRKPNLDFDSVYASIFNKCFRGSNELRNRSYILDNLIISKPFSNLPHAVALSTIIQNFIK